MLQRFDSILASAPQLNHVEFASPGSQKVALGAPVTELITLYTPDRSSALENGAQKLAEVLNKDAPGFLAAASGWVVEEVEHEKLDGGKGRAYFMAIGWRSVEDHLAYRETESFRENIGLLRDNAKAIEMHHVAFVNAEAGGVPRPDDDPRIGTVSGKEQSQM